MKPVLQRINLEKFSSVSSHDNAASSLLSAPVKFSDPKSLGGLFMRKNDDDKKNKGKDERRYKMRKVKEESNRKFLVRNRGKKESIFTFRNLIILVLILSVAYYFFYSKNKQNN